MGESSPRSPLQTERSEVLPATEVKILPYRTPAHLIICLLYGQTKKRRNKNINNFLCFPARGFLLVSSPNGTKITVQSPALYKLRQ